MAFKVPSMGKHLLLDFCDVILVQLNNKEQILKIMKETVSLTNQKIMCNF